MKIDECYQELTMERERHRQTLCYYNQLRSLYYRETGINFVPTEIDPHQVKPGFFRRFGRVVWPLRLWVA
jgi:hypothetical protein